MQVNLTIMHISWMHFNFIHEYVHEYIIKYTYEIHLKKCTTKQRKHLKHFFYSYIYNNKQ